MIDALASEPHYVDHLAAVWAALPDRLRGRFIVGSDAAGDVPVIVASYRDQVVARRAGRDRIVVMEHGIGQSYGGDRGSADHPSYPGGTDRGDAALFLTPNDHSAARWRAAYPAIPSLPVGSPRLDALPGRSAGPHPVVAIAFHWDCRVAQESRSAFNTFRPALPGLARRFALLGHGHPRAMAAWQRRRPAPDLTAAYTAAGIEVVPSFDEICERADVFVADNTSSLFEFASTGRPVVVLNAPGYRRSARHGLRFWEAADVGINVDRADELVAAVESALVDAPEQNERRERALGLAYAFRSGGGQRAAAAIAGWLQ